MVDLNCDMGEGSPDDKSLMPFISSANIACGAHAGNETSIRETIALCMLHNVAVGAHPSFYDRENFGRTELKLDDTELYNLIIDQLRLFTSIATEMGATVHHIKPHGALYNMAAREKSIAASITKAVYGFDKSLVLYGLAGSYLITEGERTGLKTASEVFADRTYQPDGSLTPRSQPNALIEDEERSVQQVLQMIQQQTVTAVDGTIIPIKAETICIHGDGRHAVAFTKRISESLKANGIEIRWN